MKKFLLLVPVLLMLAVSAAHAQNEPNLADSLLKCSDTSGSATAQSCTAPAGWTLPPLKGDVIVYYTTTANTGALTLNFNGSGAAPVQKLGGIALAAGDIQANKPVLMTFDGTNWQISGSPATLNYFSPDQDRSNVDSPRNGSVALWSFVPPANVTFSHIVVNITTIDATNLYSFGIYDNAGNLVSSTTAASFGTAGIVDLATSQGSKTLTAGNRYYFAATGNAATLAFAAGAASIVPVNNGNGSLTTGGVLPATTTIPADAWIVLGNLPYFALHP